MAVLGLDVSVVVYRPDLTLLWRTLSSLDDAVSQARRRRPQTRPLTVKLWLVNNNSGDRHEPVTLRRGLDRLRAFEGVELLYGHGNVGYGAGHNLAIARGGGDFHLVLNSDVEIAADALDAALQFLDHHSQAGLLAPAVAGVDGQPQYLCKAYPSVFDLLLRGFAPAALKRRFRARLERYELRSQIDSATAADQPLWDVPIVSGCFMLIRRAALDRAGGFCPRYFLYFEDFDLSLRLAAVTRSVYLPSARIVHHGGEAARKGWCHVAYFARSALLFFQRNGWRWR